MIKWSLNSKVGGWSKAGFHGLQEPRLEFSLIGTCTRMIRYWATEKSYSRDVIRHQQMRQTMRSKTTAFQSNTNWKIRILLVLGDARPAVGLVETATEYQRRRARAAAIDDSKFVREMTMINRQLFSCSTEPQQLARRLYDLMESGLQQHEKPMVWFRRIQTEGLLSEDASSRNLLALHFTLVRTYMLLNRIYWFKLDRICRVPECSGLIE
jgi:hypothetical protein